MGAALAASALPGASPAGHPDAELLDVLARFRRVEAMLYPPEGTGCRTIAEEDARALRLAPLHAERAALADRACALRARTPDGWRARAMTLLLEDGELQVEDEPRGCVGDRLLYALIRDMLAEPEA